MHAGGHSQAVASWEFTHVMNSAVLCVVDPFSSLVSIGITEIATVVTFSISSHMREVPHQSSRYIFIDIYIYIYIYV